MRKTRLPVVTTAYTFVLVATEVAQHVVSHATRHRLLTGSSTDVAHLLRDPALVLLASAIWLPDTTSLVLAPLLVVVLAVGEHRFGGARVVAAFVIGHVVSTVLTEGAIWASVHAGWIAASHEHRLDVGPSYGAAAVLGLLVTSLPPTRRYVGYAAMIVLFGVPLVVDRELTTVGHVLAAAVGVALWRIPWFRLSRARRATPREPCRRGCSSASRC